MAPEVFVEQSEMDVSDVQIDKTTGRASFVRRTVFADEREALVISGRRAAKSAKEIVGSDGFDDLLVRYDYMFWNPEENLVSMLEKRKIDDSQRIPAKEKGDFKKFCAEVAAYDGSSEIGMDVETFDIQMYRFKGLLNYWLGLRSSAQVNYQRDSREKDGERIQTTAQNEAENLRRSIAELITNMNKVAQALGSTESIDVNENMSLGPVETIVGAARNSMKQVFRAHDGGEGLTYDSGIDIKTSVKRRKGGAPIGLEFENFDGIQSTKIRPADEHEILGEGDWTMRNYNVGGIPVSIYFNSKYGTHFLPGLEALFGEMGDDPVDADGPVKIYFGVDPNSMMEGQQRTIYSRHGELRMMISAEQDMDYFGYLKKSMLTMTNLWISMLSSVMARKNYSEHPETRDRIKTMMDGFPLELNGLHEELYKLLGTQPIKFEGLLPKVRVKEMGYSPKGEGFNSGQYILMPVHGAAYTIKTTSGKEINFVLPGDSGVGKSEVLRELINMGIEVISIQADDMLYMIYDRETGSLYSVGTEKGAYTKTDDLPVDGKVNTSDKRPLVGYNAEERKGNRRVVEPFVSNPNKPKRVDGLLALVNAYEANGDQRVKKVELKELVETWVQGPYKQSSSVQGGGGKSAEIVNVPFWNEFGPDKVVNLLRQLIMEIFVTEPEEYGATSKDALNVIKRRGRIKAYKVDTAPREGEDLSHTFRKVAAELKEIFDEVA